MREGTWEHFEHDADIGLRACAGSREELFELMGEALTALVTDPASVRPVDTVAVSCKAPDDAMLLVDWLNALVYEMATRRMLFSDWRVGLDNHELVATIVGETVDRDRHQPVVEVKGATYTALSVTQESDGTWRGQCVVDV
ncbi:MAG: archease [Woeseiaceae bacterium]|nr:archease [Woeseiaceae bacterium]NIP20144.1 archease [Woeseiaceae bacterium]NIS88940.1 archease [Woeseiaceae bacterium]